jgi:hypothetical protein
MESQSRTTQLIQTSVFGVPEYEIKRERTYRPRISPEHSHRLWVIKQKRKKPITKLVDEILNFYFESTKRGGDEND